jgi:O-antigen/teichoic acid export membrane protein
MQFLGQVSPVLVLPAVLSRTEFVDYSLVVPLGVLAGSILCGWLTAALARHAFAFLAPDSRELRSAVTGFFALSGGLCLALYLLLDVLTDSLFAVVPLLVFAGSLRTAILVTLNSAHRPRPFFAASVLYLVPTIAFLVACGAGVPAGLERSLLLLVAGETTVGVVIVLAGDQELLSVRRTDWQSLREYFAFGAPLIPGAVALWVLSISDRYLLAAWTDEVQTANYVLSYQLGGAIINYPRMLFLSVFEPKILLKEQERGTGTAQDFIRDGARHFARWVPLIFVLACVVVLVGKRLAYPGFEPQVAVTSLIIGAHLIQAAGHFPRKSLELAGRTRRIAVALGLAAATNVAANVVLIPWAGALGAAAATALAYAVYVVVLRRAPDSGSTRSTTA